MKKTLIIATAILLMASCKKEMGSENKSQPGDLALSRQADIATHALATYKYTGTGVQTATSRRSNTTQLERPLKDFGSGTISYIPNACGEGTLKVMAVGTGNSTAMGSFTQVTSFCADATTGAPLGSIDGVIAAANGDKVYYTFVGMGTDPSTGFPTQDYIFTGGTGRFTDASGNLTLIYSVRTATNYTYTGTGSITY